MPWKSGRRWNAGRRHNVLRLSAWDPMAYLHMLNGNTNPQVSFSLPPPLLLHASFFTVGIPLLILPLPFCPTLTSFFLLMKVSVKDMHGLELGLRIIRSFFLSLSLLVCPSWDTVRRHFSTWFAEDWLEPPASYLLQDAGGEPWILTLAHLTSDCSALISQFLQRLLPRAAADNDAVFWVFTWTPDILIRNCLRLKWFPIEQDAH